MKFPFSKKIITEEETINLAGEFALQLKGDEIIILNGNLGAGKTFFIKQAFKALNVEDASSPTFALVNEYYGKFKAYHFDFYRINVLEELYDIGIEEYLSDDEAVKFIEWGNLFPHVLPDHYIEIKIILHEDFSREFYFREI